MPLRIRAAYALGKLGKADARVVPFLTTIVNDSKRDLDFRLWAAEALANLGKVDVRVMQFLTTLVKDVHPDVNDSWTDLYFGSSAIKILGNLGKVNARARQFLTTFVNDSQADWYFRSKAAAALGKLKPLNLGEFFVLLDITYRESSEHLDEPRFNAYFYGGGNNDVKTLLKWMGRPASNSLPTQLTREQGKQTLEVFARAWEASAKFPRIRNDLAQAIDRVTKMVQWQPGDIPLLKQHKKTQRCPIEQFLFGVSGD